MDQTAARIGSYLAPLLGHNCSAGVLRAVALTAKPQHKVPLPLFSHVRCSCGNAARNRSEEYCEVLYFPCHARPSQGSKGQRPVRGRRVSWQDAFGGPQHPAAKSAELLPRLSVALALQSPVLYEVRYNTKKYSAPQCRYEAGFVAKIPFQRYSVLQLLPQAPEFRVIPGFPVCQTLICEARGRWMQISRGFGGVSMLVRTTHARFVSLESSLAALRRLRSLSG